MDQATRYLVAWDFAGRPKSTFYEVLAQEFGDVQRTQKSVAVCKDDFTARRLRALLEWYGAKVCAYAVNETSLDDTDGEATAFVQRVHAARKAKQGRRV